MKHAIILIISTIFLSSIVSIPARAQELQSQDSQNQGSQSQVSQNQNSQQPALTSLSVTPPLSEIVIKPGKAITQAFTIKNEGKVDLEVTPTIVDFSPDGKTGAPILLPNNTQFPFGKLENLDKKLNAPFTLQAGKSDQLVVRIAIPEKAEEKEYYQTLLFQTKPKNLQLTDGSGSVSQAWIGVHMLISVSKTGEPLGALTIHSFEYPKIIDIFSPLKLNLIVKNNGKNYTKAQGEIKITSITNDVIKVFPLLPENILANSVRLLHASIPDPEDPKSASAAPFEYRPLFLLGPLTISVNVYADGQKQDPVTYSTLALPISPTLALLVVILTNIFVKKFKKIQREI